MYNPRVLIGAVAILTVLSFTTSQVVNWKVKEGYTVKCVEVGAYFKGLTAVISFDEDKPENSIIKATIEAKTVEIGTPSANTEAKKILEADKFPLITFELAAITKTKPGQYDATGFLTMKGITKEVKMVFNFSSKKSSTRVPYVDKEIFAGSFTFAPKDFNIEEHKEKMTIELMIPVTSK